LLDGERAEAGKWVMLSATAEKPYLSFNPADGDDANLRTNQQFFCRLMRRTYMRKWRPRATAANS
jgi:hypothetical protein